MRTSYSALETYINCPQKYKFQEIDRIKTPKSKEAVFGTLIHNALRYFHGKDPATPSLNQLLAFFKNIWNKDIFLDSDEEKVYFFQGLKILEEYYRKNGLKKINIIGLETRFEAQIGDHLLTGKIDRIDKSSEEVFEIIDYKTGRKMPSQERVDNDLQLAIYNIGFLKKWPAWKEANVKLSLYFLKHGEKISTQKSKEELLEAERSILKIIDEISGKISDNKPFEPIPSKLCDFCGYKKICPMWKDQFRDESENNLKDVNIKETATKFIELKKEESAINKEIIKLKEIVNLYCDKNNVERIFDENDNFITRSPRKTYKYNADEIEGILEPLGLLDKVLEIDKNKLNKLIKTLPENIRRQITDAKKIDKEYKVLSIGKKRL